MFSKIPVKKIAFLCLSVVLLSACASPTAVPAPTATIAAPTLAPTATSAPVEPTATLAEPTATAAPTEIKVTDGLGREITLDGPAQRIVSLGASNTEILYALGAGDQVVGRDAFSDYPTEAQALADVGGSMGDYDLEAIVALKPDLVLMAQIASADQAKSIADLGLNVFYLNNPVDLDGLYTNLTLVASLIGRESEAEALNTSLKERVSAVTDKIASLDPAAALPVVFYELDGTDPAKPYTSGPGTFIDQMITMAGGKNAAADLGSDWGQLSVEQLLVINPDMIILGDANYGMTPEAVAAREGWQGLKAVQGNQLFTIDDNTISRPGPRMVDGLENLAKLIHPELFSN